MPVKRGKRKYRWNRWPNIAFFICIVAALGGCMLYWSSLPRLKELDWFFIMLGSVFFLGGIAGAINEFFNGVVHTQIDEWPFEDLDKLNGAVIKFDNGLVVDIGGFARFISYNFEKIFKRQSIIIKTFWNRKGKLISYRILCE